MLVTGTSSLPPGRSGSASPAADEGEDFSAASASRRRVSQPFGQPSKNAGGSRTPSLSLRTAEKLDDALVNKRKVAAGLEQAQAETEVSKEGVRAFKSTIEEMVAQRDSIESELQRLEEEAMECEVVETRLKAQLKLLHVACEAFGFAGRAAQDTEPRAPDTRLPSRRVVLQATSSPPPFLANRAEVEALATAQGSSAIASTTVGAPQLDVTTEAEPSCSLQTCLNWAAVELGSLRAEHAELSLALKQLETNHSELLAKSQADAVEAAALASSNEEKRQRIKAIKAAVGSTRTRREQLEDSKVELTEAILEQGVISEALGAVLHAELVGVVPQIERAKLLKCQAEADHLQRLHEITQLQQVTRHHDEELLAPAQLLQSRGNDASKRICEAPVLPSPRRSTRDATSISCEHPQSSGICRLDNVVSPDPRLRYAAAATKQDTLLLSFGTSKDVHDDLDLNQPMQGELLPLDKQLESILREAKAMAGSELALMI